eukprot:s3750_g3.t1
MLAISDDLVVSHYGSQKQFYTYHSHRMQLHRMTACWMMSSLGCVLNSRVVANLNRAVKRRMQIQYQTSPDKLD